MEFAPHSPKFENTQKSQERIHNNVRFFGDFWVTLLKTLCRCKNEGYTINFKYTVKFEDVLFFLRRNGVLRVTGGWDMNLWTRSKIEGYICWGLQWLTHFECLVWAVLKRKAKISDWNLWPKGWNYIPWAKLRVTNTYWANVRVTMKGKLQLSWNMGFEDLP